MNRRTLLAALGTVGAGGAVVTGTGAFTSVEANRDLTVQVADDASALLALRPHGENGDYVQRDSGTLGIDITSDNSKVAGDGVNPDAVTLIEDLFEVQNQGTQGVEVGITPTTFIDTSQQGGLLVLLVPTSNFPVVNLGTGNTETYSLVIATVGGPAEGLEVSEQEGQITVFAEATA